MEQKIIKFWNTDEIPHGHMCNFYPSLITVDGRQYPTVEHYFQATKMKHDTHHIVIQLTEDTNEAKALGNMFPMREDWAEIRYDVMVKGLREKYKQPFFKEKLLATGDAYLIEDSPTDAIWGQVNGVGQNLLGKALMQVREELKNGTIDCKA